ncbi:hypothetical protein L1887_24064 [Cichorium endivia]|nr:hypothetical protein L1887_24064 [Cichorium endivia]
MRPRGLVGRYGSCCVELIAASDADVGKYSRLGEERDVIAGGFLSELVVRSVYGKVVVRCSCSGWATMLVRVVGTNQEGWDKGMGSSELFRSAARVP